MSAGDRSPRRVSIHPEANPMCRVLPLLLALLLAAASLPADARTPRPGARDARGARAGRVDSLGPVPLVLRGPAIGDLFGVSIAKAGDVNGDGYDDLIVGSLSYDGAATDAGRAYLFAGSPAGLDTVPVWVQGPSNANAQFGVSVAGVGDLDGDGYDEVLVGAGRDTVQQEGRASLFRGGPAGPEAQPSWVRRGAVAQAWFGTSVAGAGDVNGDGEPDVVIGAPNHPTAGGRTGAAFVYYGTGAGLGTVPTLIPGAIAGSWFGYSVAGAGDVNGDGFGDLVVGAVYASNPDSAEGLAYLYLGSPSGIATTPAWVAESDSPGAGFGGSVSGAGDVNADGYADVIVGAHHFDSTLVTTHGQGRAFLYFGSPAGLGATAPWWVAGQSLQAHLGQTVGFAGDVNGDGVDDLYVGSHSYTGTYSGEGRLELFYGHAGTGPRTVSDWSYAPGQYLRLLGHAVAGDMDLNGDTAVDVATGTAGPDNNYGQVYVFFGVPGPLAVPPAGPTTGVALGRPAPHPFRDRVRLPFTLPAPGRVRLAVFDVGGRSIATLLDADRPAGPASVTWDGRDDRGVRCAAGVYVVHVQSPAGSARRLVALLR
jgi:hypothetical protein